MTRLKLLGVAGLVVSSALASQVLAQDAARDHAQKQMRAHPQAMHRRHVAYRHNHIARNMAYSHNIAYRNSTAWNNAQNGYQRDPGFWPGDVAAGAVGGALATAGAAVNTAGAIATAPFRSEPYAYYNNGYNNGWNGYNAGWNNGYNNGWYGQSYAQRNASVCQPGTWYRGDDGRRHLCQ
jgi:hypothetical protein